MKISKRVVAILILAAMLLSSSKVEAKLVLSKELTNKYINKISERQMRVVSNPAYGTSGGEWTVLGLAKAQKITSSYKEKYKQSLKSALDSKDGKLSSNKYTEYARVTLALSSIGENPFDFCGYDVISPLTEYDNVLKQGINGIAYSLLAIESGAYDDPTPKSSYKGLVGTKEKYKDALVKASLPNGGWSLFGKSVDVDVTSIVIQVLAPHYKEKEVKKVVDAGIKKLASMQKEDGTFESMGNPNCESTAQVLVAMATMGISVKDKRFVKNNKTVLDGLFSFYKDSGFSHLVGYKANQMATDQGMMALVAYKNFINNEKTFYNMKSEAVKNAKQKVKINKKSKKNKNKNNTNIEEKQGKSESNKKILKNNQSNKKRTKNNKEINTKEGETDKIIETPSGVHNKDTAKMDFSILWYIGAAICMVVGFLLVYFLKFKRKV